MTRCKTAMTLHSVLVPEPLWRAAMKTARRRDQTLSAVIRRALVDYVNENKEVKT